MTYQPPCDHAACPRRASRPLAGSGGWRGTTLYPPAEETRTHDVGLPWVRLDTAFPSNPKLVVMLLEKDGSRAALAYLCGLCHCGVHGTDGFISREVLPYIHARQPDADRLVRHGFWIPRPGGWLVNGWDEFQESSEETKKRSQRAQHAAELRWAKARENGDGQ